MKRLALAALLCAAAGVAGCTAPRPVPPPSAAASPASLPSPVILPSPSVLPSAPPDAGPSVAPFGGVDVVIPAWAPGASQCSSGRLHLDKNGQFIPAQADKKVVGVGAVTPVDFDGDGTDEYAVFVGCGEGPEAGGRMIVGYRRSGSSLRLIGRIVGTQDGIQMMDPMRRRGNGIEVLTNRNYTDGGPDAASQWRTYGLRDGRFRAIGAPVAYRPIEVHLRVEVRQLVMRTAGPSRTGTLHVTVRNDSKAVAPSLQLRLTLPASFQPAGSGWTGCAVEEAGHFVCPLPDVPPGSAADVSFELLGPAAPAYADDLGVAVRAASIDVTVPVAPAGEPLTILYP